MSDSVYRLPIGTTVGKEVRLTIRRYEGNRAECVCTGCRTVIPNLDAYSLTTEQLEFWLDDHMKKFPRTHGLA